jgi:manganese/zinc/iron transport system permease protein
MSSVQFEIQLIAAVVAVACALPGVFLVLRRMALVSDAISHAILLGIVLAFFVTRDITSPFLLAAATLTGVLTVSLIELINRTKLVKEDTSLGLVFPVLFSIGVILIARYAGNIHLDVDAVLMGELAFAPLDRLIISNYDFGPRAFYVMSGILFINILFITIFFKELKLASFDMGLAASLGFSPVLLHYVLITLVSVTAVGAFDAVGSILVVALMITPPAAAYLITDRLSLMLILSALIGILSAVGGYWVAHFLDASLAGSMATVCGFIFCLTFLTAPQRGIIAIARRKIRQKWEFASTMLAIHLYHHEGLAEASRENRVDHLSEHLRWDSTFADDVVRLSVRHGLIEQRDGDLMLTDSGRQTARQAIVR